MNNNENYKKAIDQIHASDELKAKTIENIKKEKSVRKFEYMKLLASCAVFLLIFASGLVYFDANKEPEIGTNTITSGSYMAVLNKDLPRFENMQELREVLEEANDYMYATNGITKGDVMLDGAIAETESANGAQASAPTFGEEQASNKELANDYSTTNTQVANVDEADIVKTDGKYIYYLTNEIIYIVESNTLKEVAKLNLDETKDDFNPYEMFVKGDKLIVLGTSYEYETRETTWKDSYRERIRTNHMTEAIVLDITNRAKPEKVRTVAVEGNYINSRMIGDNVYFISNDTAYYYDGILDEEILPLVKDTVGVHRYITCNHIAYFEGTDSHSFMTVAGFNINNNNEVNTETFFGASSNIYCSENNLYITQIEYSDYYWGDQTNIIYKFNLEDSKIQLVAQGKVDGYLNDQFSMDEYEGNLRIATTSGYDEESTNQLYILNEDLKEISRIDNLAPGEKIYSVRFIGKVGYIVTFEQIDPLFVIDLSNPKEPVVKGELKIPGYSSYLHPYDETHIIGIGYNTRSNGYGGVTNANLKMSMFDVSDLENPVEMFHVDIGGYYASSEITYNHKALFYNKEKNLIGFPLTTNDYNYNNYENGFVLYNIDLEKGFVKHGEIMQDRDYRTNIKRGIYVGDSLYTLAERMITKYDLYTLEKNAEIQLLDYDEDVMPTVSVEKEID